MIHYYGQRDILARLNYRPSQTTWKLLLADGLPAYKRKAPRRPGKVWYTNEALLLTWELARVRRVRHAGAAAALEATAAVLCPPVCTR